MLSAVKSAILVASFFLSFCANAREIHVLIVGDGVAANCNAHQFGPVSGVYEVTKTGAQKPARDPLELAGCDGGSVWLPLGAEMIKTGFANKVVLVSVAVSGGRTRDWLQSGSAYGRLGMFSRNADAKPIRFDYALWYQGNQEPGGDTLEYFNDLRRVVRSISLDLNVDKWIIAQGGGCVEGKDLIGIANAQSLLAKNPVLNRFPGPDIHKATYDVRGGSCRLDREGQIDMAHKWLNAIKRADADALKYQKESLLFYFK
jgi:hypothetical protein